MSYEKELKGTCVRLNVYVECDDECRCKKDDDNNCVDINVYVECGEKKSYGRCEGQC